MKLEYHPLNPLTVQCSAMYLLLLYFMLHNRDISGRLFASFVAALVIFVEGEEQTDWFSNAELKDEADFENVTLMKDQVNTVSATFKSRK